MAVVAAFHDETTRVVNKSPLSISWRDVWWGDDEFVWEAMMQWTRAWSSRLALQLSWA